MDILCIGSATKDLFFPTAEGVVLETPEDLLSQKKIAFEAGAKYHIENRYESLGGCSVNVAVGLKRLGLDAGCYSAIGDDVIGKWIFQHLAAEGLNLENIKIQKDCQNDLSAIIVDKNSGERIIFSCQTSNNKLEVEQNRIGDPEWIFIGDVSGDWKTNVDRIIEIAQSKNIKIGMNPRQKMIHDDAIKITEIISNIEILFVNKDEAIEIVTAGKENVVNPNINDEKYLLEHLKEMGAEIVVLTDGGRGAWGYNGSQMLHTKAMLRSAVDTTGAGDAFTSGFFAACIKGKSLEQCLKWGIINSSSSVQYYGGQQGLLNEGKILESIGEVDVENLIN